MSKYIELKDAIEALYKYGFVSKPVIEEEIRKLPTIDIVWCSDCINNQRKTDGTNCNWCLKFGYEVYDDDFCGYGEEQVASKLNNPDDSLLAADSDGRKEQKSKLESEKVQLSPETSTNGSYIRDGRLMHDLVYRGEAEVDTPTEPPTNTPTDLISRQAAIEAMRRMYDADVDELIVELESLPPAEPQRPKGRVDKREGEQK